MNTEDQRWESSKKRTVAAAANSGDRKASY